MFGSEPEPDKCLGDFLDSAAADAGCAGAQTLACAIDEGANGLQIYIPAAIGYVMGVADLMPKLRTLAAHFTNSCHLTMNS
jgi:hypothetical protein